VWHADRRDSEFDDLELDAPRAGVPLAEAPLVDDIVSGPYPVPEPGERFGNDITEPVRAVWRGELAGIGGRSPLLHFDDGPTTRIELSTTHPGGLARFITGTTTLLSQLIRDDMALRGARIAADRIAAKGLELATTRGIDSIRLGIGIATWGSATSRTARRSCCVRWRSAVRARRGAEAARRPPIEPRRSPRRSRRSSASSRPERFVAPERCRRHLQAERGHRPVACPHRDTSPTSPCSRGSWSRRSRRSPPTWSADAHHLDHPILDALAGNATAKWAIEEGYGAVQPVDPDRASRPPTCCCSTPTRSRRTSSLRSRRATPSS
jgi:hypothetical protein